MEDRKPDLADKISWQNRPLSPKTLRMLRRFARLQVEGHPVVVTAPTAPIKSQIEALERRGYITSQVNDGTMNLTGILFRWNYTITVTEDGMAEANRLAIREVNDALNAIVPGVLRQLGDRRAGRA